MNSKVIKWLEILGEESEPFLNEAFARMDEAMKSPQALRAWVRSSDERERVFIREQIKPLQVPRHLCRRRCFKCNTLNECTRDFCGICGGKHPEADRSGRGRPQTE